MILDKCILLSALIFGISAPVFADVVEGVWKSTPDVNGLVVHVRAKACGQALCGVVERAKDRRGYDKKSTAVGKRVFWDMVEQPDGTYEGTLIEPSGFKLQQAKMMVEGNAMHLVRCAGATCDEVIWTRLR
jgi:uncharacterized protein (DUF2147 family)